MYDEPACTKCPFQWNINFAKKLPLIITSYYFQPGFKLLRSPAGASKNSTTNWPQKNIILWFDGRLCVGLVLGWTQRSPDCLQIYWLNSYLCSPLMSPVLHLTEQVHQHSQPSFILQHILLRAGEQLLLELLVFLHPTESHFQFPKLLGQMDHLPCGSLSRLTQFSEIHLRNTKVIKVVVMWLHIWLH